MAVGIRDCASLYSFVMAFIEEPMAIFIERKRTQDCESDWAVEETEAHEP